MLKGAFKKIIAEFPQEFEGLGPLVEKLRGLLFPIIDEDLFMGSYRDPDRLYKPMIDAFEEARSKSD